MEKKNYVIPQTEQMLVSSAYFLLQTTSPTAVPLPPGPGPAPGRKTF